MKRLIPIVILLVAAIAAGVYFYPRLTKKPAPTNQLTLSGNIEAHESLVSFKVQGRIVELPVEEGQQVEQGALLARLEDADYKQKVRIDEASVAVRESNLALTLAGTREQEVKASQQAVFDAQADLAQKKLDNDRAQQLFSKDEISAQDRDLAATALKRSEANVAAAQQRYNEAAGRQPQGRHRHCPRQSCPGRRQPWPLAHRRKLHHAPRALQPASSPCARLNLEKSFRPALP